MFALLGTAIALVQGVLALLSTLPHSPKTDAVITLTKQALASVKGVSDALADGEFSDAEIEAQAVHLETIGPELAKVLRSMKKQP